MAIRRVLEGDLARIYRGTTAADAAAMAALWTEQSTHGGVLGTPPTRAGRAAVQQMWVRDLTGRPKDHGSRLEATVASLQWLRPDLAAADVLLTYTGGTRADGTPAPAAKHALYAVMVREAPGWRIAASRIAVVPTPAEKK